MNIGIIGAGNIGGVLATHLSKLGHEISISNSRGPDSLKDTFGNISGVTPATVKEVVINKDIIIIAIPQRSILNLSQDLFDGIHDDVVVIDTCNYYPRMRDGKIEGLENNLTNSEWVQSVVKRPVVKAFNSIASTSIDKGGRTEGDPDRIAIPIAGDRTSDKKVVHKLMNSLGFDCYDVGLLAESWKFEPGTPCYCMDFNLSKLKEEFSNLGNTITQDLRETIIRNRTNQEDQILEYFAQQKS